MRNLMSLWHPNSLSAMKTDFEGQNLNKLPEAIQDELVLGGAFHLVYVRKMGSIFHGRGKR